MATLVPDRVWVIDERGDLTFREVDRRTNALARALQKLGVSEGDSVALMARNHRGFVEATVAAAKLGADLIYLNTAFAGPQLVDVLEREEPSVVVHDEEFTGMLEKAHVEKRVLSWVDGETDARHPRLADRGRARRQPVARPGRPQPDHHPHVRDHRYAEGRSPQRGRHRRRDLAALADAAEVRLAGAHRGAAVPHLGLRAPDAVAAARPHDRAAAQVRPGGRARPGRRAAVRRDGRDPGDAAADARAARREARQVQPRDRQGGRRVGLGAARRPRAELDGPLRRQPLQHLRLDRGRLRLDRHPRGHAPGAVHGRQAAVGDRREDLRRQGQGGPAGRVGPDLRRQQPALRGLHRRRPEGHDRRPDVLRATWAASTSTGSSTSRAATTR